MSLRFHEIAEANHRILNPFTPEKLALVGEIARLDANTTILDLCCGKAEMLCQWAKTHGIRGTGVDISTVFLPAARERAIEMGVADRLSFVQGDAAKYVPNRRYNRVCCIGATWIGGGLVGTLELMKPALEPGGMLLVGEPYWSDPPPDAAFQALGVSPNDFASLVGTLDRFESASCELVEMVLADGDSWDRYAASQWLTISDYLATNPGDPEADALRDWTTNARRAFLEFERRYLGWGVFVLRVR